MAAISSENRASAGLTRIKTRTDTAVPSPKPPAPASKLNHKVEWSNQGIDRGKKISGWLGTYLSKDMTIKLQVNGQISTATSKEGHMTKKQHEDGSGSHTSNVHDSASGTKPLSKDIKSFSHELGLGSECDSGMPSAYAYPRVHSYDDLKEVFGCPQVRFDAAKEMVNMELASFIADVMDYLSKNNSGQEILLKDLLHLAQRCITMTSLEFRAKCQGIVQDLTQKRQQLCEKGVTKWLFTRILFILTRCTRLLQLHNATEFSHFPESAPVIEDTTSPILVICRICEKTVPAQHLESHSYICAHADKCDSKCLTVDERLYGHAEILDRIIESRNYSLCCDVQGEGCLFEDSSPKMSESPGKGVVEGMFEGLHEMDTASIDDSMVLKSPKTIGSMTSGSSTNNTPRAVHFDLFWLDVYNHSRAEDVQQIFELADIARTVAATDISEESSCAFLIACMQDLQGVLRSSKLEALVIDTFGGRIATLLQEKYMLACQHFESKNIDDDKKPKKSSWILLGDTSQSNVICHLPSRVRTTIDDFEIIKPISRGSFGKVFLARKRTTGDLFAIKVLKKLDMLRKNDIEQILAERNILIAVRNPFVVRFYYSFTSKNNLYLVMEYLNGGDLYSLLRTVGCLQEDVARTYAAELVLASEYLHSLEIVHRDLKPDNILIAHDGHIKLTDFGLSKIGLINSTDNLYGAEREGQNADIEHLNHKQTEDKRHNSAVGTPDYLAPEILLGTDHGPAADWWSIGIILFELITGMPPFSAESPEIIFDNILSSKIPWPDVPSEMSLEAQDLIKRFLVLDPNSRLGAKGSSEVKAHPFFKGVDWDNLASQKAAFVPQPDRIDDTSYFVSRHDISFRMSEDLTSSDSASEASSSFSNVRIEMDENCLHAETDSSPLDLSLINFSFKNLSQLASINHDVLLGKDPTKCSSPSQAMSS